MFFSDNHISMASDAEKLQSLLICGLNHRPKGSRQRLCAYLDVRLLEEAEMYGILSRKSRTNSPPSLSIWIETTLANAVQDKKVSQ